MQINHLFVIVATALLSGSLVNAQTGPRVQTFKPIDAPKVIKFQGKGSTSRIAVNAARPAAHTPVPLSSASLAQIHASLGFNSTPTSDYLLLTPQQPHVSARGDVSATNAIYETDQNRIYFAGEGFNGVNIRMKPGAVGQTYLIDIMIDVAPDAVTPKLFKIETPDQVDNATSFSKPGIQHVLLTFTSTSTDWQ